MALFRASLRTFSRSKGESATAAAAYRAGIDLPDDRLGMTHKFSRRQGVEAVRHFAPAGAPVWAYDTVKLWNAAEAAESRSNSRVARELVVSLPHELSATKRLALAEEISQALVERYKIAVMLAMHAPDKKGDARNHHCHVLMSTRELTASGFGAKVRALDDRVQGPLEVDFLRAMVEQKTNAALEAAKVPERVDRRSLEQRSQAAEEAGDYQRAAELTREPTLVVGRAATAAARRGVPQERVRANALIRAEHEQDLAAYLVRARQGGRLMPPSSDHVRLKAPVSAPTVRVLETDELMQATGKDAELLNAQAATARKAREASRRLVQAYIDGLRVDALTAAQVVEAYLALTKREHELALWMQRSAANTELTGLLRGAVRARLDLMKANALAQQRRSKAQTATVLRRAVQDEENAAKETAAPAWNLVARRRWKAAHVAQAAKLRRAVAAEQQARAEDSRVEREQLHKQSAELRKSIADAEYAIRAQLNSEELLTARVAHPAHLPEPGRTRPRLY